MKRISILAVASSPRRPLPFSAIAHKTWLRAFADRARRHQDPWITVDAAVSNDLFYFNHVPLRTGQPGRSPRRMAARWKPQNLATGKYRNVFDVQLKQQGTYRIANGQQERPVRSLGYAGKPGRCRRQARPQVACCAACCAMPRRPGHRRSRRTRRTCRSRKRSAASRPSSPTARRTTPR
jgi:hypothetical protein